MFPFLPETEIDFDDLNLGASKSEELFRNKRAQQYDASKRKNIILAVSKSNRIIYYNNSAFHYLFLDYEYVPLDNTPIHNPQKVFGACIVNNSLLIATQRELLVCENRSFNNVSNSPTDIIQLESDPLNSHCFFAKSRLGILTEYFLELNQNTYTLTKLSSQDSVKDFSVSSEFIATFRAKEVEVKSRNDFSFDPVFIEQFQEECEVYVSSSFVCIKTDRLIFVDLHNSHNRFDIVNASINDFYDLPLYIPDFNAKKLIFTNPIEKNEIDPSMKIILLKVKNTKCNPILNFFYQQNVPSKINDYEYDQIQRNIERFLTPSNEAIPNTLPDLQNNSLSLINKIWENYNAKCLQLFTNLKKMVDEYNQKSKSIIEDSKTIGRNPNLALSNFIEKNIHNPMMLKVVTEKDREFNDLFMSEKNIENIRDALKNKHLSQATIILTVVRLQDIFYENLEFYVPLILDFLLALDKNDPITRMVMSEFAPTLYRKTLQLFKITIPSEPYFNDLKKILHITLVLSQPIG